MKLKTFFIINAAVGVIYALAAFIIPQQTLAWHGIGTDASAVIVGRFFAVEILGVGLVAWFARNSDDSKARQAIVLGLFLHEIVGAIYSVWVTLTGGMGPLGWLPVAIYVLLGAGYGYYQFGKPEG
jgi:hypothetical protein